MRGLAMGSSTCTSNGYECGTVVVVCRVGIPRFGSSGGDDMGSSHVNVLVSDGDCCSAHLVSSRVLDNDDRRRGGDPHPLVIFPPI